MPSKARIYHQPFGDFEGGLNLLPTNEIRMFVEFPTEMVSKSLQEKTMSTNDKLCIMCVYGLYFFWPTESIRSADLYP